MAMNCSFCLQSTDSGLLAISSKMPSARICDKCLFKETGRVLVHEHNLATAFERIEREHKTLQATITGAIESRVQALNTEALALDSELVELRETKRQLQDALSSTGTPTGGNGHTASGGSSKADLRATAVKRLIDERMTPASGSGGTGGRSEAANGN